MKKNNTLNTQIMSFATKKSSNKLVQITSKKQYALILSELKKHRFHPSRSLFRGGDDIMSTLADMIARKAPDVITVSARWRRRYPTVTLTFSVPHQIDDLVKRLLDQWIKKVSELTSFNPDNDHIVRKRYVPFEASERETTQKGTHVIHVRVPHYQFKGGTYLSEDLDKPIDFLEEFMRDDKKIYSLELTKDKWIVTNQNLAGISSAETTYKIEIVRKEVVDELKKVIDVFHMSPETRDQENPPSPPPNPSATKKSKTAPKKTSIKSECSGKKFTRHSCTQHPRSNKCQWANGPRRSFCRKISKRTLRDKSVTRIQSQYKKRRKKTSPTLSPKANHFHKVAGLRDQGSIRIFYERCRLFPHPIMMFSEKGIDVPVNKNYGQMLMTRWNKVHVLLKHIPQLKSNQHIYTHEGLYYSQRELENTKHVFRKQKFSSNSKDVIIGIKRVHSRGDWDDGHVVFFEVRMEDTPTAIVIDPNGTNDLSKRWVLDIFFGDIPYTVIESFNINQTEKHTSSALSLLGFEGSFDIGGYCATIACFTLVDYVCTNQWRNVDLRHFTRATREWLYSPEENRVGEFCKNSTQLRLNIISRYMAYHLIRLMEIPHEDPIMKNVRITVWREREKLASKFIVGDKAVLVQGTPYPISELETTYDALKF